MKSNYLLTPQNTLQKQKLSPNKRRPQSLILQMLKFSESLHYKKKKKFRGFSETPTFKIKFSDAQASSYKNPKKKFESDFQILKKISVDLSKTVRNKRKTFDYENKKSIKFQNKNRPELESNNSAFSPFFLVKNEIENNNYLNALKILNENIQENKPAEFVFTRGLCYMHLENFEKALQDFLKLKNSNHFEYPSLFINLYTCYHQTNDIDNAIKCLNIGIKKFPQCSQIYLLRGKAMMYRKNYDLAIKDLKKIKTSESYFWLAECYKNKKNYEKAYKCLEFAKKSEKFYTSAVLQQGKIDYKLEKYEDSINKLIIFQKENTEAIYYIGKSNFMLNNLDESEFLFEEVIQTTTDPKLSTRAACKLGSLKLKKNDFYGAVFAIGRRKTELISLSKKHLLMFSEALLNVTKKNFSESIFLLTNLLSQSFNKQQCFIYRAYSYFSIKEYSESLKDYEQALLISELDEASNFNYSICKIMTVLIQKDYKRVFSLINSQKFSITNNLMPAMISVFSILFQNSDQARYKDASKVINELPLNKSDSEVLFYSALLHYIDKKYEKSMDCINLSISLADKNYYFSYVLRGFCFITFKVYSEAVEDFSVALKINDKLAGLYPYRGVCAFFIGDRVMAIEDLLRITCEYDQDYTILSLYLLIFAEFYEEALNLLKNSSNSLEFQLLKAHSYLMTLNFPACISVLQEIDCKETKADIQIISNLAKGIIKPFEVGVLFNKKYITWLEALESLYKSDFKSAITKFESLLDILIIDEGKVFGDSIVIEEENCEILYNIALCNLLIHEQVLFI